MTIKDRRDEFINYNLSLCEKNCNYSNYDYKTKKVLCECFIKLKFPLISEVELNKDKLLNKFIDIKQSINLDVMKCYKKVFNKKGITNNIGFYIMSTIIFITLVLCILFRIKGYEKLKIIIDKLIQNKKGQDIKKKINKKKIKYNPPKNKIKKRKLKVKKINILKTNDDGSSNISKLELKNLKGGDIKGKNILINNNILNNNIVVNYNDYELNTLSYNEALKLDKRTFFQYYFSLLKTKHILIFSFYTNSDYNSQSIKIILFLFSFSLYFTINALFFTDTTIHKIHVDQGKFNIIYQIPIIIYSTIITSFINTLIKYFSLTEKNIAEIKKEKNNIMEKRDKLLKSLIAKFIIFFILVFLFLILFWYYLSCFCAIYYNSQIHLIKDTLISFGLSLLYPFGLNVLPGLFRISSLANKNRECMFKVGQIIQFII